MTMKWRVFISSNRDIALGMRVTQDEELWIPEIVAISNLPSNHMRLDRVREPHRRQMKINGARATLSVHYVQCVLPLTLEDQRATVGGTVLAEDRDLRALPNYSKRGTWYKIAPR
jgi:hypothetical protein